VRHLSYFLDSVTQSEQAAQIVGAASIDRYEEFLTANAESVWTRAACAWPQPAGVCANQTTRALFGLSWAGPCLGSNGSPSPPTQVAALDVLISAAARLQLRAREGQQGPLKRAGSEAGLREGPAGLWE
jgi:hypothetical protein